MAATYMANAASHASPVRGGTLKAGYQGGASSDTLDPALFTVNVMIAFGKAWGETLVEVNRIEVEQQSRGHGPVTN